MLGYQYLRKIEFQSPKLHVPCLFHLRDLLRMMVTKSQSPEIAAIKYPRAPMIGMSNSDGPMAGLDCITNAEPTTRAAMIMAKASLLEERSSPGMIFSSPMCLNSILSLPLLTFSSAVCRSCGRVVMRSA